LWHSQLLAESLGKNGFGFSPYPSIGSIDLHSLAQLYYDGPKDKIFSLISINNYPKNLKSDFESSLFSKSFPSSFNFLKNNNIKTINQKIFLGVKNSFIKQNLPFIHIQLERLDEYHLGYLMQYDMLKTIFLAKLFNINPFDQPAVELYKTEIKKIL
jgi:glucose-6-phosphate isomerase